MFNTVENILSLTAEQVYDKALNFNDLLLLHYWLDIKYLEIKVF